MSKFIYVHIYRKKLTYALTLTIIGSIIYVFYQIAVFWQITEPQRPNYENLGVIVMGIDPKLQHFYEKNDDVIFQCIKSGELISYDKINDDYCDCSDGSDEPGTNACGNGEFYCLFRGKYGKYPRKIPSDKVNDRVCDCCDGSDEWKHQGLLALDGYKISNKFKFASCPRVCLNFNN
nr:glucosidase 2 subunit beta [Onthophagus taurus]